MEELRCQIQKLKLVVPPRGKGRTTQHCEQWQIYNLLITLQSHQYLKLPFQLIKSERSDIIMVNGPHTIGIELTEIINPDYARAQTLAEAQNPDSVLDPSKFKWGNHGRPLTNLRAEASQTKLTGPAWVGDSVEREFAVSVNDTVLAKHKKLMNEFKRYNADLLLVYHNNSTPALDFEAAIIYTDKLLNTYWNNGGFDVIIVHKYDTIIIFTKGLSTIIKVNS
jgi:hypothetical protein